MAVAWDVDDEGVDVTGEGVCTKDKDGVDAEEEGPALTNEDGVTPETLMSVGETDDCFDCSEWRELSSMGCSCFKEDCPGSGTGPRK